VAIVSREFVRRFVPDNEPIGRTVRLLVAPGEPQPAYEIVGVAGDTKYYELRDTNEPLVYLSAAQEDDPEQRAQVVVQPRGAIAATTAAVLAATNRVAPGSFVELELWEEAIRNSIVRERLMATLSGAFAAVAAVLAAVGLYGLLAYAVARRTPELGLRIAMGDARRRVATGARRGHRTDCSRSRVRDRHCGAGRALDRKPPVRYRAVRSGGFRAGAARLADRRVGRVRHSRTPRHAGRPGRGVAERMSLCAAERP
jgi:hypothetical protein